MPATDAQLVERALEGDQDAFRALVVRHQSAVYGLLARMLRHPALAEDLAQETFLRAFARLETFDPAFRFPPWILRIAHNLAVDALRRRKVDESPLDDETGAPASPRVQAALADPDSDAPSRRLERQDLAAALDAALARLRPEYRALVVLRHHQELGHEEIARVTGLPVGTVKSYLHRARGEMARFLEAAGWAPATRPGGGT